MKTLTKTCSKCGIEKDIEQFLLRADRPGKRRSQCIDCRNEYIIPYNKNYLEKNKELIYSKNKIYQEQNKEAVKAMAKNYYENNKKQIRKSESIYRKEKKQNDVSFKILCNTKRRILIALQKQSASKSDSTFNLTGLSGGQLSEYLLGLGYNPEIHHIDHYLPLARFDLLQIDHQMVAFYYLNLQPLLAKDNHIKRDSLPDNWKEKVYQICEIRNINPEPIINYISIGVKC